MIMPVAKRDLASRPGRTFGMVAVVAALAFALFAGSVLTVSLQNGSDTVEKRLGADAMVVPAGYGDEGESILVSGSPSAFYMDSAVADAIASSDVVERSSPQLYLTSVPDADCCDYLVQIIGYDSDTDFTITPWISETFGDHADGIIVGSNIYPSIYPDGMKVTLFGHQFYVNAKLSPSGTGADNTVYMGPEALKTALEAARTQGFDEDVDPDTQVSAVMVELADRHTVAELKSVLRQYDVDIVESDEVITDMTTGMGSLVGYVQLFQVTVVFLAAVVLVALFSLFVFEDRKEFAILRMMGASRASVCLLVLTEAAVISIAGAAVGVAVAGVAVIPLEGMIGDAIGMPYMSPEASEIIVMALASFAMAAVVGSLSASVSSVRLAREDAYHAFRRGE